MDRVRFGRALGFGTRQAMKTLAAAVDAATAEDPSAKSRPANGSTPHGSSSATRSSTPDPQFRPATGTPTGKAAQTAAKTVVQARQVKQGFGRGSRRFGEAVWGPFVRLSGVLWLEVSGVFFGLFALMALGYLWKLRGAWHSGAAGATNHRSLIGALIMFALFGYFCVSSFLRARRRERDR